MICDAYDSSSQNPPGARCIRGWALPLVLVALVSPAAGKQHRSPADLLNPVLSAGYSHWLIGPIYLMATRKEVDAYLSLSSDDQAATFIATFWEQRAGSAGELETSPRKVFEDRATAADARFTEHEFFPGHRSDRGSIYVLFGEPHEISFETHAERPTLEVWKYGKGAPPGLHGEKPKKVYRFVKLPEATFHFRGWGAIHRHPQSPYKLAPQRVNRMPTGGM